MNEQRTIVHMDMDTFFVSCERRLDSRLEGKPIIIGGSSDRGVVASCSYEARKFGVHSAMPVRMARERCPEAIIIKGNSSEYTNFSRMVTEIIRESVPSFEKSSIDEFYLDLSGMDRFFGCMKYTSELRQRIMRETGLPLSFGLSVNKTVAKIATGEAKPNNQLEITRGSEKNFLSPLSVRKIPSVGLKTYQTLCGLGVRKIYTVQEMPRELMEKLLGVHGAAIWKKAQGIDHAPIEQYSERKSISCERTFEKDTIDLVKLRSLIAAMAENLIFHLRQGQKVTACVTVKIRYSDFQTKTLQQRIPYTAADHEIIPVVMDLFHKLFNRRLLVRLIGVRLSELVSGFHQMQLFGEDMRLNGLYNAMDHIRLRYGDNAVVRAAAMQAKTIGRFHSPFSGEPPVLLANRSI